MMSSRWTSTFMFILLVGCAAPQRATPGELGSSCEAPEDCNAGLACKAAICANERSEVGGICVTNQGCEPGLSCVSGRCASGRATPESCVRSCAHIKRLMENQHQAGRAAGQGDGSRRDSLARMALIDFERQCRDTCVEGASQERADCLSRVEHLDEIKLCP